MTVLYLVIGILVLAAVIAVGLVTSGRRRRPTAPPPVDTRPPAPGVPPSDEWLGESEAAAVTTLERPEGTASRLARIARRVETTCAGAMSPW